MIKGATKSQKIIFVSATKIGRNTTNILNCYFSSEYSLEKQQFKMLVVFLPILVADTKIIFYDFVAPLIIHSKRTLCCSKHIVSQLARYLSQWYFKNCLSEFDWNLKKTYPVTTYGKWRYCTFVLPLLLLMTHHEKTWLKALPQP